MDLGGEDGEVSAGAKLTDELVRAAAERGPIVEPGGEPSEIGLIWLMSGLADFVAGQSEFARRVMFKFALTMMSSATNARKKRRIGSIRGARFPIGLTLSTYRLK